MESKWPRKARTLSICLSLDLVVYLHGIGARCLKIVAKCASNLPHRGEWPFPRGNKKSKRYSVQQDWTAFVVMRWWLAVLFYVSGQRGEEKRATVQCRIPILLRAFAWRLELPSVLCHATPAKPERHGKRCVQVQPCSSPITHHDRVDHIRRKVWPSAATSTTSETKPMSGHAYPLPVFGTYYRAHE